MTMTFDFNFEILEFFAGFNFKLTEIKLKQINYTSK